MKPCEVIPGREYTLRGYIQNGAHVTLENVTRKVIRVTQSHIYCECGRKFIINDSLLVEPFTPWDGQF